MQATKISERRPCALVGLSRDSVRNPPSKPARDQSLRQRIVQIAHERRRLGYRRIADMLRAGGEAINDKRVYRLYRAEQLALRKRRGRKRLKLERVPLHVCSAINEVWSLDFVSDSLANGRRIKCLAITDDYRFETLRQAREALAAWRQDFNEVRPHSSCGRMPPARFAVLHRRHAGDAAPSPTTKE